MFWDWLFFNRRLQLLESLVLYLQREVSELKQTVTTLQIQPSIPTVTLEREMADKLVYRVNLVPVPEATDVVQQFLAVSVGENTETIQLTREDLTTTITVDQGSTVGLSLKYVDDAGNVSQARELSFEALDTLPPAVPGEFSVTLVSETTV